MAAELGTITDPKSLVQGNADAVRTTAAAMRDYGDALHEAGEGLKRIDIEGWSGQAAEQFRSAFDGEPIKWLEAGDCFQYAGGALEQYSESLTWAQGRAAEAIRLWNEGEAATQQAKAEHARAAEQVNSLGAAGVGVGGSMVVASLGGLGAEAAGDDRVEVIDTDDAEPAPAPALPWEDPAVQEKIPEEWGDGKPNNSGVGHRWLDPIVTRPMLVCGSTRATPTTLSRPSKLITSSSGTMGR
ncbi:putative T7SS-secreted protein [Saccharopolyspora phatthalungensis]